MRLNNKAADFLKPKKKLKGSTRDNELWNLVKNETDLALELRKPYERVWLLCMSFLSSRQYVLFNSGLHQIQDLVKKPNKSRTVDNQLLPKWKRQVSDLIKNDPEMSVVPNTLDDEDRKAAKTGDVLLKHWWRNNGMKKKTRRLAVWLYTTGNAFVDDRWNPKLGPTITDPERGTLVYGGDVDCGVWSPFNILAPAYGLDPGELNDLPWMATAKWRPFQWFYENFEAKRLKDLVAEEMPSADVQGSALFGGSKAMSTEQSQGAIHYCMKIKPCKDFPKGILIHAANGVILEKPQDYPFKHFHMEHFKDLEMPGCFYGSCELEHGLGLQTRWNRTLNSIDDFNKEMAKGKWLIPRGANVEADPNDQHGEVIKYSPVIGHKPELVSLKGLPTTYPMILESTRVSLEDLFSQHEVSRGTNKSDIRSGEMVALLREQDAHGSIPSHMVYEEAMEAVSSRVLKRIQQGYKEERMLKIKGEGGQWDIQAFKGTDLRSNWDVSIERQSSLPDSRIAREARILERYEKGLYGDPRDPEVRRQVMNMLDDAVVKNIFNEIRLDEQVARNENELLSRGTEVIANIYDNHAVHAKVHKEARKTAQYQRLKMEAPEQYAKLEQLAQAHIQLHEQALAEQRKQMLQEQMFLKGGGADAQGRA